VQILPLANRPASQGSHVDRSGREIRPDEQVKQVAAPLTDCENPGGHKLQVIAPEMLVNRPTSHGEQRAEFVSFENVPG